MIIEENTKFEKSKFKNKNKKNNINQSRNFENTKSYSYNNEYQYSNKFNKKNSNDYLNIWKDRDFSLHFDFKKILKSKLIPFTTCILILLFGILIKTPVNYIISAIMIDIACITFLNFDFYSFLRKHKSDHNFFEKKPFKDFLFFFDSEEQDSLFLKKYENRELFGMFTFKLSGVPISIEGNPNRFLKSLYQENIKFTYQLSHKPNNEAMLWHENIVNNRKATDLINKIKGKLVKKYNPIESNPDEQFLFEILINITENTRYIFNVNYALKKLKEKMYYSEKILENLVNQNFSHYKFNKLSKKDLVNACLLKFNHNENLDKNYQPEIPSEIYQSMIMDNLKLSKISKNFKYFSIKTLKEFALISLNFLILNVFLIKFLEFFHLKYNFFIILNVIFLFYISFYLITEILDVKMLLGSNITIRKFFNPFKDINFIFHKKKKDSIYLHLENKKLLIGVKYFLITKISTYLDYKSDNFIRACTVASEKIPFTFSLFNIPLDGETFLNKYFYSLKNSEKYNLETRIQKSSDFIDTWMDFRGGIFDTIHLYSIFDYKTIDVVNEYEIAKLDRKLNRNYNTLLACLNTSMKNFDIIGINNRKQVEIAFILETLKDIDQFPKGTKFPLIPIQSKNLSKFIQLSGETKRGIRTQLPVEFITPEFVFSDIKFGNIFNMINSKIGAPIGYNFDDFKDGVIISGDNTDIIDLWTLRIAYSLIKQNIPGIIFDWEGIYSCLYNAYDDLNKNNILFIKLGRNYSLRLFNSEFPSKLAEGDYLKYMIDSFGIAYNFNDLQRILFENMIRGAMDKNMMEDTLNSKEILENLNPLNKRFPRDTIESINNITQKLYDDKNLIYFGSHIKNQIPFEDIVFGKKTIIFDLSNLQLEEKILSQMILLSKILHYSDNFRKLNTMNCSMMDLEESNLLSDEVLFENIKLFGSTQMKNEEENEKLIKKLIVLNEPTEYLGKSYSLSIPHVLRFIEIVNKIKEFDYGFLIKCSKISQTSEYMPKVGSGILGLQTIDPLNKKCLANLLHLDSNSGRESINSKILQKRKDSYQFRYLEKQDKLHCVYKSNSWDFPFAVELDYKPLESLLFLSENEKNNHMLNCGIDNDKIEQEMIQVTKKTEFEKDFLEFSYIYDDIIGLFKTLQGLNNTTELKLTKDRFEKEIKEYLGKKIKEHENIKNSKEFTEIKKRFMNKCINLGYLKQNYNSNIEKSSNTIPILDITENLNDAIIEYENTKRMRKIYSEESQITETGSTLSGKNLNEGIENEEYSDIVENTELNHY